MAVEADYDRWKQLGRFLERRRYDIDPRYGRNLQLFADDRQISSRLCWDIENTKRINFERHTLARIAEAYGLDRWALEEFLEDGKPLTPADENPYADDPELASVWAASQGVRPDARHGLVEMARKLRDRSGSNGDTRHAANGPRRR